MEIKPIVTNYAGHEFRSRLEARWAVFFDCVGIKWEYEREGYDIGGKWYLPDFYLLDYKLWVEIKHADYDIYPELEKYIGVSKYTKNEFIVVQGVPSIGCHTVRMINNKTHADCGLFRFARARRSKDFEMCLVSDNCARWMLEGGEDDGNRWPLDDHEEIIKAFEVAMKSKF